MSNLRRYFQENDTVFVTVVTHERAPTLVENSDLLFEAVSKTIQPTNCELVAYVILPDHWHGVFESNGASISSIIQSIKMSFGARYRGQIGERSGKVWQNRFWDHIIRDQEDLNTHINYIHFNAVKHGLVRKPKDWRHSSIHLERYSGVYTDDWGVREVPVFEGEFGE